MNNKDKTSLQKVNNLDNSLLNSEKPQNTSKPNSLGWIKQGIIGGTMLLSSILGAQETSQKLPQDPSAYVSEQSADVEEESEDVSCQNLNMTCQTYNFNDGLDKLIPLSEICTSERDIKRNIHAEGMPKNSISMIKINDQSYLHIKDDKLNKNTNSNANSENSLKVIIESKEFPVCKNEALITFKKEQSNSLVKSDNSKNIEVKPHLEFLLGEKISVLDILKDDSNFTANYFVQNTTAIKNYSSGDVVMIPSEDGLFLTPTLVGTSEDKYFKRNINVTTKNSDGHTSKTFASIRFETPEELLKEKPKPKVDATVNSKTDENNLVKQNLKDLISKSTNAKQNLTVGGNVQGNSNDVSGGANAVYALEDGKHSSVFAGSYNQTTSDDSKIKSGFVGAGYDFNSENTDFSVVGTFEGSSENASAHNETITDLLDSKYESESFLVSGKIGGKFNIFNISAEGFIYKDSNSNAVSGSNTTIDNIDETRTDENGITYARTGEIVSSTEHNNSKYSEALIGEFKGTLGFDIIDNNKTKFNISAATGVGTNEKSVESEINSLTTVSRESTTDIYGPDGSHLDSQTNVIDPITGESTNISNPSSTTNSKNVFMEVAGDLKLNLAKAYVELYGLFRVNGLNNEVKRSDEYHRFQGALNAYAAFDTKNDNKIIAGIDASRTNVENAGATLGFLIKDKDGKLSRNIGDYFTQSLKNEFSSVSETYKNVLSEEYLTHKIADKMTGFLVRGNVEKSSSDSFMKGFDGVNGGAQILVGLPYVTVGAKASSGNGYSDANSFGGSVYLKSQLFEKIFDGNYSPSVKFGVSGTQGRNGKKGNVGAGISISLPLQKNHNYKK